VTEYTPYAADEADDAKIVQLSPIPASLAAELDAFEHFRTAQLNSTGSSTARRTPQRRSRATCRSWISSQICCPQSQHWIDWADVQITRQNAIKAYQAAPLSKKQAVLRDVLVIVLRVVWQRRLRLGEGGTLIKEGGKWVVDLTKRARSRLKPPLTPRKRC